MMLKGTLLSVLVVAACAAPVKRDSHVRAVEPTKPHLTIGRVATSQNSDAIHQELEKNLAPLQGCFEKAHATGTVTVWFRIETDGSVPESMGRGDDKDLSTCVADAVRELRFAAQTANAASVTFTFGS
jgi:hypothetical protein